MSTIFIIRYNSETSELVKYKSNAFDAIHLVTKKPHEIKVVFDNNSDANNITILYGSKKYTTDDKGKIYINNIEAATENIECADSRYYISKINTNNNNKIIESVQLSPFPNEIKIISPPNNYVYNHKKPIPLVVKYIFNGEYINNNETLEPKTKITLSKNNSIISTSYLNKKNKIDIQDLNNGIYDIQVLFQDKHSKPIHSVKGHYLYVLNEINNEVFKELNISNVYTKYIKFNKSHLIIAPKTTEQIYFNVSDNSNILFNHYVQFQFNIYGKKSYIGVDIGGIIFKFSINSNQIEYIPTDEHLFNDIQNSQFDYLYDKYKLIEKVDSFLKITSTYDNKRNKIVFKIKLEHEHSAFPEFKKEFTVYNTQQLEKPIRIIAGSRSISKNNKVLLKNISAY